MNSRPAELRLDPNVRRGLRKGAEEFNSGKFFECHDTLEDIWQGIRGPARDFFQGLIQVSVGFYHLGNGNRIGAASQLEKGLAKLSSYGDCYVGMELETLRREAQSWLARIRSGEKLHCTIADLPKLHLLPMSGSNEMDQENERRTWRPTDLRGILQYIPRFRDRIFILSLDGGVVTHENFANLLLDIAVLRSLNIRVVIVHGASAQISALAAEQGFAPSDLDGTGVTDAATFRLALTAANRLTHEILEGLFANDLRAAYANVITAHPLGGCAMASNKGNGVVHEWGEVFDEPGLYVCDGSVLPGPVGPNPALTIGALADRFATHLIETRRN